MSLISRTISQLFGGVSQQPSQLRSDSQCSIQDNCWPDVSVGLSKRPPSLHVAKLNADATVNRAVHFINRDASEKYVVVVKDEELKVYDQLTGAEKTVTAPDGLLYLDTTDPTANFAFLTVADTTFVVNRSKTVTLDAAGAYTPPNVCFVYIISAVARQKYTITLDGTDYTYTVANDGSDALTTTIAEGLKTLIGAATFTVTRKGSILKIVKNDASAFTSNAFDSYGDAGLIYFTDEIESSAQLPPDFWTGYVLSVKGAKESGKDDYYLEYANQRWVETVKPGLQNTPTPSTMPHKLVRNGDGTFTFSKVTWVSREVGDDETNPAPSFIGQTINNVFFHRERLGLLSGENIVMSRVADFYNFFASSASSTLDDDPIDATVSDPKVSKLYHALGFQEALLVFSDTAQFQLTGGDVLSPKTVRLNPTTHFYTSKTVPPVAAGRDVYFSVGRGNYSSMREYFVLPDGFNSDAADITAHIPTYVPKNLGALTASSLMDALFMYSRDEPNVIYFYKYLWAGDQKVQSAWGTVTLADDVTLIGMEVMDTILYLAVRRADGTYIEKIDFQAGGVETGMSHLVHLDRRYSLTGVYDAGANETTWTLPHADTDTYQVVLGASFTVKGAKLNVTHPTSTTLVALGDYSAGTCFVGKPYSLLYRFSELYIKNSEKVAVMDGKLMLRNIAISYTDSSYFRVEVTPKQREKNTYVFTGRELGAASALIGSVNISSGSFKVPIVTSNLGVTIDIVNDSHLPSTFQGATWQGLYSVKAKPA